MGITVFLAYTKGYEGKVTQVIASLLTCLAEKIALCTAHFGD